MNKICALLLLCIFVLNTQSAMAEQDSQRPALDGIWQGQFDINGSGPFDFTAIHIGQYSSAVSSKAKTMCTGEVSLENGSYQAKYTMYSLDGSPFDHATITGTLIAGQIESQFVTEKAGDTGVLTLSYNPIYEENSSLDKVQGAWEFIDRDNLQINWQIDQGVIQGNDSDNCEYSGEVALIDPEFNAYAIRLDIASCSSVDGEYAGFAYIETTDKHYFRMDLAGEHYGFHFDMQQ